MPLFFSLLWVPIVLVAALAQTARNATQRALTKAIGAVGATQVRFLYGLPFAILFLALVSLAFGQTPDMPGWNSVGFLFLGAVSQIAGTALMLLAMRDSHFTTTTALLKMEPVLVAATGFLLLGDELTWLKATAIGLACGGVLLMTGAKGNSGAMGLRAVLLGLAAAALYGFSAVGFRGAILALPEASFVLRASTILVAGLTLQTALLGICLLVFNRAALRASIRVWRQSLLAGFFGAFASQFWFLGFALTSAANVRTLALVEVLMAGIVSRRLFKERLQFTDKIGIFLMLIGLSILIARS